MHGDNEAPESPKAKPAGSRREGAKGLRDFWIRVFGVCRLFWEFWRVWLLVSFISSFSSLVLFLRSHHMMLQNHVIQLVRHQESSLGVLRPMWHVVLWLCSPLLCGKGFVGARFLFRRSARRGYFCILPTILFLSVLQQTHPKRTKFTVGLSSGRRARTWKPCL